EVTDELVSRARTTALFGTDLTAIVPGSPDTRLTALLDRVADREAQGTATSWRFSPASVRRAFDQGATAAELLDDLGAIAAGDIATPAASRRSSSSSAGSSKPGSRSTSCTARTVASPSGW